MPKFIKTALIIVGAVAVTALGIDAADTLTGSRATLLGQLAETTTSDCPAGMVLVPAATSFSCVDIYEAAPAEDCEHAVVQSAVDTKENIKQRCEAVSEAGRLPWSFVARDEAQTLCLQAGKRLPSNSEWQMLALGSQEEGCNIDTRQVAETGERDSCISAVGAHDAVGNVWEWTSDDVIEGRFGDRQLPETGFVQTADSAGLAIETGATATDQYGNDYFWSRTDSVSAVMRGGFYGSGDDAGVYSVHADVDVNLSGAAIGFRCVL